MATGYGVKKFCELYHQVVVVQDLTLKPVLVKLIGNMKGKTVVDLGCGDGRYAKIFARQAKKVIGIDVSPYQIEIAKRQTTQKNIKYLVADASETRDMPNISADLVFMNLVIPDLKNPKKLGKVFQNIKRMLKKDGKLILCFLHPLYFSPEQDKCDKPTNFDKRNYFHNGHKFKATALVFGGKKIEFNDIHFTLEYISKQLEKNDFLIKRIRENKVDRARKIFLPKYLIFEAVNA